MDELANQDGLTISDYYVTGPWPGSNPGNILIRFIFLNKCLLGQAEDVHCNKQYYCGMSSGHRKIFLMVTIPGRRPVTQQSLTIRQALQICPFGVKRVKGLAPLVTLIFLHLQTIIQKRYHLSFLFAVFSWVFLMERFQ